MLKFSFWKSSFVIFCLAVIILQFIQIIYLNRGSFTQEYNVSYWKDRVEHSQWSLPLSDRVIGDDGLYSYVGYRLVEGASPDFLNAEIPPLGKYLIGLSILIFGSPAYYGLVFGVLSLILFYFISNLILKDGRASVLVTALLFLDPIFFSQFWNSWLDVSQLFFLFLNVLTFILAANYRSKPLFILSGLTLGLFAVTKPPILLPLVLTLELIYFLKLRRIKEAFLYLPSLVAGLLIPYVYFFLIGNSLIDFFRLQKFAINFYLISKLDVNIGAVWTILLLGKTPHITSGALEDVKEWWIMWTAITAVGIFSSIRILTMKNNKFVTAMAFFLLLSIIIYTFIPLYTRYLLPIIPFMYLLSLLVIKGYLRYLVVKVFFVILLIYGLFNTFIFIEKNHSFAAFDTFSYSFSSQFFKDIYHENLSIESKKGYSMQEFNSTAKKALGGAGVVAVEFSDVRKDLPLFSKKGEVSAVLTYKTRFLGEFSEEKTFELVREHGTWKIDWSWSYVLDEYNPRYSIETDITKGNRGVIRGIENGLERILAADDLGFLISVNPTEMDKEKEEEILSLIGKISAQSQVALHNAYTENVLPDTYVPLATTFKVTSDELKARLDSYEGVRLTEHETRIYGEGFDPRNIKNTFFDECCTRIYSSYSYHGVEGPEEDYDEVLSGKDGGKIVILDENGEIIRTVLAKDPKNGQDIVVDDW